VQFRAYTGKKLNWKNPRSFNEKTQLLKLYDYKTWYSDICDKVEVRKYVSEKIGDKYLIPIIAVFNSVNEIEWDKLPKQFVLKCTHDSGTTVVCTDKATLDIEESKRFLARRMKKNYFYLHREYCYKNIKPRVVCEEYISENGTTPNDYKFFCFHGVVQLIQVDTDRFTDHGRLTLLPNFEPAPFHIDRQYLRPDLSIKKAVEKPANFEEMMELSRILSKGFKFIRVDLYSVGSAIYFGELTFYQNAGYEHIYPDSYNDWMGDLLDLNKN
jgi:hypothetical protein